MEEYTTPDPAYVKGFNDGYIVTKHLPDLGEKIAESVKENKWSDGFKDGREQVIHELDRELYPSWLKEMPPPDTEKTDPSIEPEMNKEMEDPEI